MTKYIFLDFDGVLNTEFYQNQLISQGKPWGDENGAFFDPKAVMQLKRIVDATCADIVIESSWKYLGLKALRDMWAARRLPGRLIDITPFTASDSWLLTAEPNDIDIEMGHCKGIEIASWLLENASKEVPYIIVDDEYVILESQLPHFILTNPYDGITKEIADRAIGMLNE